VRQLDPGSSTPTTTSSRYMEPKYRDKAVRLIAGENGKEQLMVGDKPFTFLQHPFPEKHAKPGSLREMLRSMSTGDYRESDHFEPVQPEYVNREARLAVMDKQGLEACFLFPTLGVCLEHFIRDDAEQTYANLHAFNRWLDEEWGFAHRGRVYAPPLLSLLDIERAVEELLFVDDLPRTPHGQDPQARPQVCQTS